jgi:hypothetical protein
MMLAKKMKSKIEEDEQKKSASGDSFIWNKNSEESFIKQEFQIDVIKISEYLIEFLCESDFSPGSLFIIEKGPPLTSYIVRKNYVYKPKVCFHYVAIVNYAGELKTREIRQFINSVNVQQAEEWPHDKK